MACGADGGGAGAKGVAGLDFSPGGIGGFQLHLVGINAALLQILNLLMRPRYQILLRVKQAAEIVAPVVIRPVIALKGIELLRLCQMDAQYKLAYAHMAGIRYDISCIFSVIHHRSRSLLVFF